MDNILAALRRMLQLSRLRVSEALLWAGLLIPLALSTNGPSRTRADILEAPLSGTASIRGGIPIVCFSLAAVLARPRLKPVTNLERLLIAFLALAALSTAWSIVPFATVLRTITLAVALLSILALARLQEEQGRNSMEALAMLLYAILLVAAAEALVMPDRAFSQTWFDPTPRLSGVFPTVHADFLGFYASAAIVLLVTRAGPAWTRNGWVGICLAAAFLAVLLLTRTRSALILLPLGLLLVTRRHWWLLLKRRRVLLLAVGCLAVLSLLVGIGHSAVSHFFLREMGSVGFLTLTGRTVTWGHAITKWSQQPFLGFGYYAGHRFGIGEVTDLDSMWLQTLLDLGVLGMVALLSLILAAAMALWNSHGLNIEPHILPRRALFIMGVAASFINGSLESIGYSQLLLGLVIFGAPRIGLPTRGRGEIREKDSHAPGQESSRTSR